MGLQLCPDRRKCWNYTRYRNNLTSILRVYERNYYNGQIEINKHDFKNNRQIPQKTMNKSKLINTILKIIDKFPNNSAGNRTIEFNINGVLTYDSHSHIISNKFNKYMTNIWTGLAKHIPIVGNTLNYVTISINYICIRYITENEF